ncbi:hypothetical protein BFW38_11690 [Terasakiispira papahanaumokuakeensis]|uniref:Catalase n=1 Tax=Terasakiispira papahanaumokuakeensis TaxID=197479 RepID=A0A1E2VAZ4_9GAMM|nr:putative metalloprotease CJM1_0395 family protein [Terasakiispira papahanaumokuakeensis]ODC04093.1 hypothetical protein BFW38_11690 [Terasakiispira papahanaumokuakeensis]
MMPASLHSNNMMPSWSSRRDQDLQQLRDKLAQTDEAATPTPPSKASSSQARPDSTSVQQQSAVSQEPDAAQEGKRGEARTADESGSDREKNVTQETADEETQRLKQEIAKLELEQARAIDQMRQRDQEVRTHERAHASAGGQWAGAPTYETEKGPDGRQYAVAGEVQIDTAPIADDPEATIEKMRTVMAAAMAPAEPSAQDRSVYAQAQATLAQAQMELAQQRSDGKETNRSDSDVKSSNNDEGQTPANNNETADMSNMADRREPVSFAFGRPRNLNVAVAQGRQFFGETASSAGEAVAFYFDWAATNRWDYTPGGRLNIAA